MSIKLELQKDSRIAVLTSEGKAPIRSRVGSFHFHSPLELLCCSYGACFGEKLWTHCYHNNIDPELFEIFIYLDNFVIVVDIKHPKNIDAETLDWIKYYSSSCDIACNWTPGIRLNLHELELTKEEIEKINTSKPRSCCGN